MTETSKQLFGLLFNRLNEGGQLFPVWVGASDGPGKFGEDEDCPPIYFWTDRSRDGAPVLAFNRPLLERICREEAGRASVFFDDEAIGKAVALLSDSISGAFLETLLEARK